MNEELYCDNCTEKIRCQQQQQAKNQRINAILSYIANDENAEYIKELKNEIPSLTRCDVVLEKQLKRLEQENKCLRKQIDKLFLKLEKIHDYIRKQLMRGVDKFEPKVLYQISKIIEKNSLEKNIKDLSQKLEGVLKQCKNT